MFDTRPIAKYMSASSADYPVETMGWGFEVYVQEAFDIGADGRVKNVSAVMAIRPISSITPRTTSPRASSMNRRAWAAKYLIAKARERTSIFTWQGDTAAWDHRAANLLSKRI